MTWHTCFWAGRKETGIIAYRGNMQTAGAGYKTTTTGVHSWPLSRHFPPDKNHKNTHGTINLFTWWNMNLCVYEVPGENRGFQESGLLSDITVTSCGLHCDIMLKTSLWRCWSQAALNCNPPLPWPLLAFQPGRFKPISMENQTYEWKLLCTINETGN